MGLSLYDNSAIAAALRGATPVSAIVAQNRGMALPGNVDPLAAAVLKAGQSPQGAAPTDQPPGTMPPPTVIQAPSDMGVGSGGTPGSSTIGAIGSSGAPLNDQFAQALMQQGFRGGTMTSPWDMVGRLAQVGVGHGMENQYLSGMQGSYKDAANTLTHGGDLSSLVGSRNPQISSAAFAQVLAQASPTYQIDLQTKQMGLRAAQQDYALRNALMQDPNSGFGGAGPPPPAASGPMPGGPPPAAMNAAPVPTAGPGAVPPAGVAQATPAAQPTAQQAHADVQTAADAVKSVASVTPQGVGLNANNQPVIDLAALQKKADTWNSYGGLLKDPSLLAAAKTAQDLINTTITTGQTVGRGGTIVTAPGAGVQPLITQQERASAGLDPKDTRPAYRDAKGAVSFPGSPTTAINNVAPNKFEETYGEGMGKQALDVVTAGDNGALTLQNLSLIGQLANAMDTGKLAGPQSTVGAWMQSVGIDPKVVGIDPNLPATAQTLNGLANGTILGKIGSASGGFPANNFSEQDRNFLLTTIPQLSDQPGAFKAKLEVGKRLAQLQIARADAWQQARQDGKSYEQFSSDWRKQVQGQNLFGDIAKTLQPSGAPAAPAPAPGAAQSARPRANNPQTGEILEFDGAQWVPVK